MQISFYGYAPIERSVTVDEADLTTLDELIRKQFFQHVEYGSFTGNFVCEIDKALLALCASYGVDGTYTPDRLAFFKAVLEGAHES
jgi:hypothetical protein